MRWIPILLGLCTASAAFAQDPGDTGTAPEDSESAEALLPLPEGTVLTFPDQTNGEVSENSLLLPLAPPSLSEGISKVPQGSFLVLVDEDGSQVPFLVSGKSWLLPDSYYTEAIVKAKQLEICQPALDKITEESLAWQERTYTALTRCSEQFDGDEVLIQDLTGQLQTMESRALVAEDRLKVARRNQAVAWAITGGLVLGASTVIVVSVAN